MAKSNAEKQRRYRERKKAQAQSASAPVQLASDSSFAEYIYSDPYREEAFETAMGLLDLSALRPVDNWIKKDGALNQCIDIIGNDHNGAIMAIATLTGLINEYKVALLEARIREIETADLATPALKEAAEKYLVELDRLKKQFHRKNRYEFLPMEVAGE